MIIVNEVKYYTLKETNKILNLSNEQIRGLRRLNNIDCIKYKNSYLFTKESVSDFTPPRTGQPPLTKKIVNERLKHKNVKITTNFKTTHNNVEYRCTQHNCHYTNESSVRSLLQRKSIYCPLCNAQYKQKDIIKNVEKRNIKFLSKFNGVKSQKLKWLCLKCNTIWEAPTKHVIDNNTGCYNCSKYKKFSINDINSKIKNRGIVLAGPYKNQKTKTDFLCKKCGYTWSCLPQRFFHGQFAGTTGCPKCNKNKNERLTGEYLKEIFPNIKINPQKIIYTQNKNLKGSLIVDYALVLNKKEFFVEYNGAQHYQPIKLFSNWTDEDTKKNWTRQTKRDQRLRIYCKKHNIFLIEIDGRKYKEKKIKDYLTLCFSNILSF
jgi:hypothetical protein